MDARGFVIGVLACLALAGCGQQGSGAADGEPFALPVGPTEWDTTAPAWFHDGTLHVGERAVRLGDEVDEFVLGATGAYWMRGEVLMFTSAEGDTEEVAAVGRGGLAVSADRSVLATGDQSRGPTDEFGTHVIQLAVFDTRTGEQLYRTPDEAPDEGADLADLYEETTPMLVGVSDELAFFDGETVRLDDGSTTPTTPDPEQVEVYPGYAGTLFPDGYHLALRDEGARRELADSSVWGSGLLSPDRSTIFDNSAWPTPAVAYDAQTGRRRAIDAPWDHLTVAGWTDEDTFFGVAERIDEQATDVLRARQVVSCELPTLVCAPVSPVIPTTADDLDGSPAFLVEGSPFRL